VTHHLGPRKISLCNAEQVEHDRIGISAGKSVQVQGYGRTSPPTMTEEALCFLFAFSRVVVVFQILDFNRGELHRRLFGRTVPTYRMYLHDFLITKFRNPGRAFLVEGQSSNSVSQGTDSYDSSVS